MVHPGAVLFLDYPGLIPDMLKRIFPFICLCLLSSCVTRDGTGKLEAQLMHQFKSWDTIRLKDRVLAAQFLGDGGKMYYLSIEDEAGKERFRILDIASKSEIYSVEIPDSLQYVNFAVSDSNRVYFLESIRGNFVALDVATSEFREIKKVGYPMVISADGNNVVVNCMNGFHIWNQQEDALRTIHHTAYLGISATARARIFNSRLYIAGLDEDSSGLANFAVYNISDLTRPINSIRIPGNATPFSIHMHDSSIYLVSNPSLERIGQLIRMNMNGEILAKVTVDWLIRDFQFLPSGDLVYCDPESIRCINKELSQVKWSIRLKDVSQINVVQDKILIEHSVENENMLFIINASNGEVSDKIKYDEVIKVLNEKVILLNGKTLLFEK